MVKSMVELLSPAGEYDSFIGAINAGADAVYLAGNMYGARASAVNFTTEEIISALNYAHLFGRKIYLTVNTLTKEEELDKLYDFIRPLYLSGLDACIVQDIGVFKYLKDCFPDLNIHISTQAVVTSFEGALFYKDLGASRVVLARELTLPEITYINTAGIETECFIHGAMCYSYSGDCLYSSFLGGNSGNRGRCKGPCRQPYKVDNKEEYILSLKDMCTVDIIDKLIDSGISSFKIEGRLKSPSYSAGVTSVYRKYIDKYLSDKNAPFVVSEEDRRLLINLYSRAGSGKGYYERVKSKDMITFDKGSYSKVSEEDENRIYDTYIRDTVKIPVEMEFECKVNNIPSLRMNIVSGDNESVSVKGDSPIEAAKNNPTSKDDITKHLLKLGSTVFKCNNFNVISDTGFVPASLVNNLRRDASDKLFDYMISRFGREDLSVKKKLSKDFENDENSYIRAFADNYSQFEYLLKENFYDSVVINSDILFDERFEKTVSGSSKHVLFQFPPLIRKTNSKLFDRIIGALTKYGIKGVYINQIDEYRYVSDRISNIEFCADTNIYSYNSESIKEYKKYFNVLSAPIELNYGFLSDFACNYMEVCLYRRAPLMQTANCIMNSKGKCVKNTIPHSFTYIKDRLNVDFPVRLLCDECLCFNTIYNSKPTSLHNYYSKLKEKGYNKFSLRFTDETTDSVKEITDFYKKIVASGIIENPPYEYTTGHIKSSAL